MAKIKRRKPRKVTYDRKARRFKDDKGLFVSELVARFYRKAQSQKREAELEENYLEEIFDEYAEEFGDYFDDVSELRALFFTSKRDRIEKPGKKKRIKFVPETPHKHLITKKDTKTKFNSVDEYLDYFEDFNVDYMDEEMVYG